MSFVFYLLVDDQYLNFSEILLYFIFMFFFLFIKKFIVGKMNIKFYYWFVVDKNKVIV